MSLATVSSKGQITLPSKIRTELGIHSNDKVRIFVRDEELIVKPLRSFRELRGTIHAKNGDHRKVVQKAVAEHVLDSE